MKIIASKIILSRLHTALNMDDTDGRRLIWGSIYAAAKKTALKYNRAYASTTVDASFPESNSIPRSTNRRELDETDILQVWYTQLDDGSISTLSHNEGDLLCGLETISRDLFDQAERVYAEDYAQYLQDLTIWEDRVAREPYSAILMNRRPRRPYFEEPRLTDHGDVETFGSAAWDKQERVNDLASIRHDRDAFYQEAFQDSGERKEEMETPIAPKNGTPEEWTLFINQLREKNAYDHNDRNNITPSRGSRGSNRLRHTYLNSDNTLEQDIGRHMRVRGKRGERLVELPSGRQVRTFIVKV